MTTGTSAVAHWSAIAWSQALDGLAAQGVDVPILLAAWGLLGRAEVTLSEARDFWVCGVLAGARSPRPIPE